ncbi:hypothetical protein J2P12_06065 [Candidatus Bathyarchaeota archaeon]|nr:hypothetical protein [Candidatus Bathyarchaeota archaeon]
MNSATTARGTVTPGSVKLLMLVEAGIICFLLYWIANEYVYSSWFRAYANEVTFAYSQVFGLALGLAGSVVTIFLFRNLRIARHKLETIAAPKILGAVDKIVSNIQTPGASSPPTVAKEQVAPQPQVQVSLPPAAPTVPMPNSTEKVESKKESS